MKKSIYLCLLVVLAGSLVACSSIQTLTFDQLYPAEVYYPAEIRNIAVVNNMPSASKVKSTVLTVGRLEGDGKLAAEALAGALADSRYFDQVVICDSALRREEVKPVTEDHILSGNEVEYLSRMLGVDMILSIDRISLKTKKKEMWYPDYGIWATLNVRISPEVSLYVPGRKNPLMTIVKNDSLEWDLFDPALSDKTLVHESCRYAASILASHLVPCWKTVNRFYYDGGCVEMRDAAVYVREGNWDNARELWKQLYERRKKGTMKMKAAFNTALSYEMTGDLQQSLQWIDKAKLWVESGSQEESMIRLYASLVQEKIQDLSKLNLQMKRFGNNFQ